MLARSTSGDVGSQGLPKPVPLKVNTPVEVTIGGKTFQGLVRWCGYIEDTDNTMAGLELVIPYLNTFFIISLSSQY